MNRAICFFFLLALFACKSDEMRQTENKPETTTLSENSNMVNPEFPFEAFADSISKAAKKADFDTLATNGVSEITNFNQHRYLGMIVSKKTLTKADFEKIVFLYNITLKHQSIKKPDSQDMTIDVYCFADTASCLFWKKQLADLYHQSGGVPLKELYYLNTYENILLHTTTRAFMWEAALDSVQKSCESFMRQMQR